MLFTSTLEPIKPIPIPIAEPLLIIAFASARRACGTFAEESEYAELKKEAQPAPAISEPA